MSSGLAAGRQHQSPAWLVGVDLTAVAAALRSATRAGQPT